jgi:hypothetical protein
MYIQKLADAAASLITVTSTATSLYDLIDTAGGSDSELGTKNMNAVDISVEDGDVRMLMDGNTPTTTEGMLLSSGNTYYYRGVPLPKMKLVRVSGDVACSVQVGKSELGENTSSSAHEVTLEAATVEIGDVGVNEIGGQDVPIDDAAMIASPTYFPSGGEYRAADTTYADGDATITQTDVNGYTKVRSKAYDSSTQSNKSAEVNPLSSHYVSETLVDETNITTNTTTYAYFDMNGYKYFALQGETSGAAPTDVLTVTVEATAQDDGTAAASCDYQDVTNSQFGVASWVDTDFVGIGDEVQPFKYVRVKYVTSNGGGSDADLLVYLKKLW